MGRKHRSPVVSGVKRGRTESVSAGEVPRRFSSAAAAAAARAPSSSESSVASAEEKSGAAAFLKADIQSAVRQEQSRQLKKPAQHRRDASLADEQAAAVGDDEELSDVSSAFDDEEAVIDSDDSSDALLDEEEESGSALSSESASSAGGDEEAGGEEDEEEEGSDSDSDDSGMVDDEYDTAQVNFDVNGMNNEDVEKAFHLLDSWIPDEMNAVDRDEFAAALVDSPHTSIVQMGGSGGAGEEEEEGAGAAAANDDGDDNVVGLISLLDVARGKKANKALAALERVLLKPALTLHPGISVQALLAPVPLPSPASAIIAELSKAVVLVNERVKNLPMELVAPLAAHTFETFDKDLQILHQKIKGGERLSDDEAEVACELDYTTLVLAKVQRSNESLVATNKAQERQKRKDAAGGAAGGAGGGVPPIDLKDFIFWREEDELLYKHRDARVAVVGFRCRAQYDQQPEAEVPLALLFACGRAGVAAALQELAGAQGNE